MQTKRREVDAIERSGAGGGGDATGGGGVNCNIAGMDNAEAPGIPP